MSNIDISDKEAIIKKIGDMQDQIDELRNNIYHMKSINRNNIKGVIVDSNLIKNKSIKNDAIELHESKQIYGLIQVSPFKRGKNYRVINKVKDIIKKSPYNQKQVAEIIDINPKTLSNILSNRYNTSLEIALKLSYLLDMPVNDLFMLEVIEK